MSLGPGTRLGTYEIVAPLGAGGPASARVPRSCQLQRDRAGVFDAGGPEPSELVIMIGQTLGPYAILEKLGEGGMGEVFRARDGKLQGEVAIKALPAPLVDDPERVARFEREAQALAACTIRTSPASSICSSTAVHGSGARTRRR